MENFADFPGDFVIKQEILFSEMSDRGSEDGDFKPAYISMIESNQTAKHVKNVRTIPMKRNLAFRGILKINPFQLWQYTFT